MQNENAVKTFRYVHTHFPLSFPYLKSHFQLYSHNIKKIYMRKWKTLLKSLKMCDFDFYDLGKIFHVMKNFIP